MHFKGKLVNLLNPGIFLEGLKKSIQWLTQGN
jgi:hypothetical protein